MSGTRLAKGEEKCWRNCQCSSIGRWLHWLHIGFCTVHRSEKATRLQKSDILGGLLSPASSLDRIGICGSFVVCRSVIDPFSQRRTLVIVRSMNCRLEKCQFSFRSGSHKADTPL